MRTNNDNLIQSILGVLTSINLKKKTTVNEIDKRALIDYIKKEFLNLKLVRLVFSNNG